jgi:hypothetical protein
MFFRLRMEFPEQLAPLTFRGKGFFPESLALDQALSNLEASRLLHRQNAAPLVYEIDPEIEDCYTTFVEKRLAGRGFTADEADKIAEKLSDESSAGEV